MVVLVVVAVAAAVAVVAVVVAVAAAVAVMLAMFTTVFAFSSLCGQCFKTFYGRKLRLFIISSYVCS